jgi:hypothetical protein
MPVVKSNTNETKVLLGFTPIFNSVTVRELREYVATLDATGFEDRDQVKLVRFFVGQGLSATRSIPIPDGPADV